MKNEKWTPEQEEYLRSISRARFYFSAKAAAAMLTKRYNKLFTKNAVIGKRYRMQRSKSTA